MGQRREALSDELKAALRDLPEKKKDQLLFRLLPGKPDLVRRLEYELLEEEEEGDAALELRRGEMSDIVRRSAINAVESFYSPGYLLLDLRAISGTINEHVKTTRDKLGEVELNLQMLSETLPKLIEDINAARPGKTRTLDNYVVSRSLKIMKLFKRFHPDLRADYRPQLQALADAIRRMPRMLRLAQQDGLDVDQLGNGSWPA